MKKHPEVIRLHPNTAPSWARLRHVIEQTDRSYSILGDKLKDIEILDLAVKVALDRFDHKHIHDDPENAKGEPIRSNIPSENIMARLDDLEAAVKTLKEKIT